MRDRRQITIGFLPFQQDPEFVQVPPEEIQACYYCEDQSAEVAVF
jgi:hypothetical protein